MKLPLFILFLVLLSLFSPLSKAQTTNSSNGYLLIKANVGSFKDSDQKRFTNGNPYFKSKNHGYDASALGPQKIYEQILTKPFVSFGSEISYFRNRSNFFGLNFGLAYSFDKTYYSFSSYPNYDPRVPGYTPTYQEEGSGSGSFSNYMFKFVWGLNFNFKFGLNMFLQPVNPEFRSIVEKNNNFTFTTSLHYYYKTGKNAGYDSAYVFVSEEKRKVNFVNYKTGINYHSLAFPTTIGLEQKFKIGKLKYVAGVSTSVSILERYLVYRAHIGVCLVNLKDKSQPGY